MLVPGGRKQRLEQGVLLAADVVHDYLVLDDDYDVDDDVDDDNPGCRKERKVSLLTS